MLYLGLGAAAAYTVCLALSPALTLGCSCAASAHHPATGLGLHTPLKKRGWKCTEMPRVGAGLQGICGSLCANAAFRNEGTGDCSGVDENSHTAGHWHQPRLQHSQTHTVWLLTQCDTATPVSMQENKKEPDFIGICLSLFFHKHQKSSPCFHPISQPPYQPSHPSTALPSWIFLLLSNLSNTSTC